jgi:hypothetical protein
MHQIILIGAAVAAGDKAPRPKWRQTLSDAASLEEECLSEPPQSVNGILILIIISVLLTNVQITE